MESKTVGDKTYKESVTEEAIEVRGYNAVAPTSKTIEIDDGANEINFYYTKKTDLSYTVHYYQEGTTNKVADDTIKTGYTFGESVTVTPKTVENYEIVDSAPITIEIKDESNECIYYYAKYLEISKTMTNSYVNVGDVVTYKITITNSNKTNKQTTVTDIVPAGIAILDSENNEIDSGILPDGKGVLTNEDGTKVIIWENIDLPEGDTVLTLKAKVRDNMIGKEITNSAHVSTLGQKESSITTQVNEIEVDKTDVKPGETGKDAVNIVVVMDLSYSMTEKNTSNGTTRLSVAQTAMKNFINKIYYDSEKQQPTNSKATVSVITFNTPEPMGNWNKKTKKYDLNIVENSGVNLLGIANKDNYSSLVNTINNLSLPSKNPERDNYNGMGTYIYGGLEKAKTTLDNTSSSNKKNVVIFLSDGDPTYLDAYGWSVVEGYEKNSNTNILKMANSIKYNSSNELVTDFYSIGFGSDASNTNSVAYKLLKQMSSDGDVKTSNSVNELSQNFTNILDDIGINQIETNHGKLIMDITTNLIVTETHPVRVTYNDSEIIRVTNKSDLGIYKFEYNETTKKLTWDINAWNESCTSENGRVKVIESNKANVEFYTQRAVALNSVNKMSILGTILDNEIKGEKPEVESILSSEIVTENKIENIEKENKSDKSENLKDDKKTDDLKEINDDNKTDNKVVPNSIEEEKEETKIEENKTVENKDNKDDDEKNSAKPEDKKTVKEPTTSTENNSEDKDEIKNEQSKESENEKSSETEIKE